MNDALLKAWQSLKIIGQQAAVLADALTVTALWENSDGLFILAAKGPQHLEVEQLTALIGSIQCN